MKRHLQYILIVAVMALVGANAAQAQLRFGIRGGLAINKLSFNRDVLDSDNRTGFTGGVMVDFGLPIVGLGIDGAVMYTHRSNKVNTENQTFKRDYIEVPIHLRYQFTIVGLNSIIAPYAFAGPNFAFLCHEDVPSNYDNSSVYTSIDLGIGVELLKHLQVSAAYSIGLNKAMEEVGIDKSYSQGEKVSGRDHCWTLTAAYLF